MTHHEPVRMKNKVAFFGPGTLGLLLVMAVGYAFGFARMFTGLGGVTNLSNAYPWGIWIGIDVASGVALAAGGFTTAALVNILGKGRFHSLERPAILTAWLGYTFVGIALIFDLGRYWNIWRPLIHWQGNSVLFEVGMCVMAYLAVLTVEMLPTLLAGVRQHMDDGSLGATVLKKVEGPIKTLQTVVRVVLPFFVIAGIVLSCMHQSSLGTLMVISPTKHSGLWWTPWLPVLFLLSAIMVGFPMVIFEGIIAHKSFNRPIDMDLLSALSRYIPWFIGIYAALKFGDLFLRHGLAPFDDHPGQTFAWVLEVTIGVVLPFFMLISGRVRRSAPLLFTAAAMIIVGVVINRINVFIVSYTPHFAERTYYPSLGEVFLTAGLAATIVFLYRFFAYFCPILPQEKGEAEKPPVRQRSWRVVISYGTAVVAVFVALFAYALSNPKTPAQPKRVMLERRFPAEALLVTERAALPSEQLSFDPKEMPSLLTLNYKSVNEKTNDYEAVRFMHKAHATFVGGDCSQCHHRAQKEPGDRVGVAVTKDNMSELKPIRCGTCHGEGSEPESPTRVGLKAALHNQCMGCHKKRGKGPTDCTSCHHRLVPDHSHFVTLPEKPSPVEVTKQCLSCHRKEGEEILNTAHWRWEGDTPYLVGDKAREPLGKKNVINNCCIGITKSEAFCTKCHAGYGWADNSFEFEDPSHIDCLACHDTTGRYEKAKWKAGLPSPDLDLAQIAKSVGNTSRESCGRCHFYGGGGPNVKHGDLSPALVKPSPDLDVHMGRANMQCADCHTTSQHRIAGRSMSVPASEGVVTCQQCHGEKPHALTPILATHLDRHSKKVACETCHIPVFSQAMPTKVFWDWAAAGEDREERKDKYGKPEFVKGKGAFKWGKDLMPVYLWYNGKHKRLLVGDKVAEEGTPTILNPPMGSKDEEGAKIFPFKLHEGTLPIDAETRTLVIPHMTAFWKHVDWTKAITDGMAAFGKPFSGKVGFARTGMYFGIHHEVAPKKKALRCTDCHARTAVSCMNCHDQSEIPVEIEGLLKPLYPDTAGRRMPFKALGYDGDPAEQ